MNKAKREFKFYRRSSFEDLESMAIFICSQIKGLTKSDVEKYTYIEFFKMHNKALTIFEANQRKNG